MQASAVRMCRHHAQSGKKRFAVTEVPNQIEPLSDNAHVTGQEELRLFAVAFNPIPCFTPRKCPQSNGMVEVFVKTLKRDYITIANLPNAQAAMRQINGWIEDYNAIYPQYEISKDHQKSYKSIESCPIK